MKKIALIMLAFLLCAPVAIAQEATTTCPIGDGNGLVINAKPLSGAESTLTFTFGPQLCSRDVSTFTYLTVEVEYTHTTNGNVVLTCTTGQMQTTATKTPQACDSVTGGACIAADAGIIKKAVTGDKDYAVRLGVRGYKAWSCVMSHDNTPVATDVITVHAYVTD